MIAVLRTYKYVSIQAEAVEKLDGGSALLCRRQRLQQQDRRKLQSEQGVCEEDSFSAHSARGRGSGRRGSGRQLGRPLWPIFSPEEIDVDIRMM